MKFRGAIFCLCLLMAQSAFAELLWVEGEKPTNSTMTRHVWYDQVTKAQLSGGDWISNFEAKKVGEAEYSITVKDGGDFEFWVRANPTSSKLSYRINQEDWSEVPFGESAVEPANIAADGKLDLRFIAWSKVGQVELKKGANTVRFRMHSDNSNHGGLDCFVLSSEPFIPNGILKPGEASKDAISAEKDWFVFNPSADKFRETSAIDMRFLNEKQAGENGFIVAKNGEFVHQNSGTPVRFWAVNGVSGKSQADLKREARQLAKYGVNLVRLHGGMFDKRGEVDPAKIRHAIEVVEILKQEGIYSHFSIFFPLWFNPPTDLEWMPGYDGKSHSFATLYFNANFQEKYREWWKALLTTPSPTTGQKLIDEPAVFGAELVNEDSLFFWTFKDGTIPDQRFREIEHLFGDWLKIKYGSFEKAFAAWNNQKVPRDAPAEGRVGFRPFWNMTNERTPRDQDTVRFLTETQRRFYKESTEYLRNLGFKGLIQASNWVTASPEVLGPIEKYTYDTGDFIDRHGYFGCQNAGEESGWSIRDGHTYVDRSALKFESEDPGKQTNFVHPVMDPHYNNKPSMISETTWNRPNRYRGEAPLYLATYGALQDSNCIVHFAKDGIEWSAKPQFFMQPWTLTAPTQMGQFPAAALIYRRQLIERGDVMATVKLTVSDLFKLKGTPLPQDASLDELRLKDVLRSGSSAKQGQRIDPLIHYVGRTDVLISDAGAKEAHSTTQVKPLSLFIDHKSKIVTSSTKQLKLDWGKGVLSIDAPSAQGVSGNLAAAREWKLTDMTFSIPLDLAHVVIVSLDAKPIRSSKRLLLQVMTEEKGTGFRAEPVEGRRKRIVSIGRSPWLVHKLDGVVKFHREDASQLNVIPLNQFGEPTTNEKMTGDSFHLLPDVIYYLIEKE